jgi:ubiquinone/menaquinone biosynthesis C-methylase UbiE
MICGQEAKARQITEMKHISECYGGIVTKEWNRLVQDPFHTVELNTTLRYLKKYLPRKGLILDAGGGPGRYTVELAKQGYNIILLDLTPASLKFAEKQIRKAKVQRHVKDIICGSITDMPMFPDNMFDAVICLGGPLSHVEGEKNRTRAVSELIRVAKKGAPVFVSIMGKYGVMPVFPKFPEEVRDTKHFRRFVETGDDYLWHGKYYSHYFEPEEFRNKFLRPNFKVLELVGLESFGSYFAKEEINKMAKDRQAWKNWLEAHYKLCTNPHAVSAAGHILLVGRKK